MDYTEEDTFLALSRIPYSQLRESSVIKLFEFDCENSFTDNFCHAPYPLEHVVDGTGWTTESVKHYINAGLEVQSAIIRRADFIKQLVYTVSILFGVISVIYFIGVSTTGILLMFQWPMSIIILLNMFYENFLHQPSIRGWRENHPSIKRKKPNILDRLLGKSIK
jgi:hypothetical protein